VQRAPADVARGPLDDTDRLVSGSHSQQITCGCRRRRGPRSR
jgi:hypothetical protein